MKKRMLIDFTVIFVVGIAATQLLAHTRYSEPAAAPPPPAAQPRSAEPALGVQPQISPVPAQPEPPLTRDGKKADSSFVRNGWWDYGSCNGEDQAMCGSYSGSASQTGCVMPAPECASGQMVAVATEEGDKKCVLTWWRWECQPKNFTPWPAGKEPARISQWRTAIHAQEKAAQTVLDAASRTSMPANLCRLEDVKPDNNAELVAIGVYEGTGKTSLPKWGEGNRFNSVTVLPPGGRKWSKPVVLVLTSYEPVEWIISPDITNIRTVVLSGYYDQRITGLKESIPVVMSHKDNAQYQEKVPGAENRIENCTYVPSFYAYEEKQRSELNASIQALLHHSIDRFAVTYSASEITIPDTVVVNEKSSR